jgi:ADP-ribose pyrophosphatase
MSKDKNSSVSLQERVLHSEIVFQGRFLKITRDQVETPDGKISHREYIKHPGAAVVLPVLSDGKLMLIRQYRHALKKVFWEIPAGKRDLNEEPLKTAHRELQEETGYTAANMQLMTVIHPVIGYADEEMHLYLATDLKPGKQKLDPGENLEVEILDAVSVWSLVEKGEISDVKTLIALFWYRNFYQKGLK